jgi:hypothetical protein
VQHRQGVYSGQGENAYALYRDIAKLLSLEGVATESLEEYDRRAANIKTFKAFEPVGRSLAYLGVTRSLRKIPSIKQIDDAMVNFQTHGYTKEYDALSALRVAREELGTNYSTDALAKYAAAAETFRQATIDLSKQLRDKWMDNRGWVKLDNGREVTVDPHTVYPTQILDIPENAIIVDAQIFSDTLTNAVDNGGVGSSDKSLGSKKRAVSQSIRARKGSGDFSFAKKKPHRDELAKNKPIDFNPFSVPKPQKEVESKNIQSRLDSYEQEIVNAEQQLSQKNQQLKSLQADVRQAESEAQQIKVRNEANKQISDVNDEILEKKRYIAAQEFHIQTDEAKIAQITEEIVTAKTKLASYEKDQEEVSELDVAQYKAGIQSQIDSTYGSATLYGNLQATTKANLERVTKELEMRNKEAVEADSILADAIKNGVDNNNPIVQQAKSQLAIAKSKIVELEKKQAQLEQENNEYDKRINALLNKVPEFEALQDADPSDIIKQTKANRINEQHAVISKLEKQKAELELLQSQSKGLIEDTKSEIERLLQTDPMKAATELSEAEHKRDALQLQLSTLKNEISEISKHKERLIAVKNRH